MSRELAYRLNKSQKLMRDLVMYYLQRTFKKFIKDLMLLEKLLISKNDFYENKIR